MQHGLPFGGQGRRPGTLHRADAFLRFDFLQGGQKPVSFRIGRRNRYRRCRASEAVARGQQIDQRAGFRAFDIFQRRRLVACLQQQFDHVAIDIQLVGDEAQLVPFGDNRRPLALGQVNRLCEMLFRRRHIAFLPRDPRHAVMAAEQILAEGQAAAIVQDVGKAGFRQVQPAGFQRRNA